MLVSTLSRTQGETAEVAAAMQQAVDDVEERARQELCRASQHSRYTNLTAASKLSWYFYSQHLAVCKHTVKTHSLLSICTCCCDKIKGTQDQDFSYSFSDSLFYRCEIARSVWLSVSFAVSL